LAQTGIGTLNEKPLHEALKRWYARTGDVFEAPVDGFVVDIVRGDLLIEIQTRNFSGIKRKLKHLLTGHKVRLVYPIPVEKWILRIPPDGAAQTKPRKSPKLGAFESVFEELIRLPELLDNPRFSLELLLIEEEEVRRYDGVRGWRRRGWITDERRLLRVLATRTLNAPSDLCAFLPESLGEPFTTADLAVAIKMPAKLAQKMTYCLRLTGCVAMVGKRGNALLYARSTNPGVA
jgi:hypothetical protein